MLARIPDPHVLHKRDTGPATPRNPIEAFQRCSYGYGSCSLGPPSFPELQTLPHATWGPSRNHAATEVAPYPATSVPSYIPQPPPVMAHAAPGPAIAPAAGPTQAWAWLGVVVRGSQGIDGDPDSSDVATPGRSRYFY